MKNNIMKLLSKLSKLFKSDPSKTRYKIRKHDIDGKILARFELDHITYINNPRALINAIKVEIALITGNDDFTIIHMVDGWGRDLYRCLDRTTGYTYVISK